MELTRASSILTCALFLFSQCRAQIKLTSSLGDSHYQSMCSGENITFTCDVIGSGILIWAINDADTFEFYLPNNAEIDTELHTKYFQATITNSTQDMNYSFLGNLSSELSVIASSNWIVNTIVIRCDDGFTWKKEQPSYDLALADLPQPLKNLSYSIAKYEIANYSVMLQWEDPSINGEVRIDNYTVILTSDNDSDVTVIEELLHYTFSLRYNVDYNLSVSVTNCMGEGEYAAINISKVGCGHPSSPVNGSINHFNSTQEGVNISFQCDWGGEVKVSHCDQNGTWLPDPVLMNCTNPFISPSSENNSTVYNTTTATPTEEKLVIKVVLPVLSAVILALVGSLAISIMIKLCRKKETKVKVEMRSTYLGQQQETANVIYEEVGPGPGPASSPIALKENEAYGPVSTPIALSDNVAYGPVATVSGISTYETVIEQGHV